MAQTRCSKKIECGSMFAHTSIMFKKKWKPAEAGNTGRGERTHVQAKRTESTCDFRYTRMNPRTETKRERKRSAMNLEIAP